MSAPLHLSLCDTQLQTVLAGASRVPPQWRTRFLDNVVDQLLDRVIDDDTVDRAVQSTLQRIGLTDQPIDQSKEPHDGNHAPDYR
jgi:hypothetical protein